MVSTSTPSPGAQSRTFAILVPRLRLVRIVRLQIRTPVSRTFADFTALDGALYMTREDGFPSVMRTVRPISVAVVHRCDEGDVQTLRMGFDID